MISNRSALGSKPALTDSELAEPRGFSFLRHSSQILAAVLVDAGFFLKRAARIYGDQSPEATAKQLHRIALDHLNDEQGLGWRAYIESSFTTRHRRTSAVSNQRCDDLGCHTTEAFPDVRAVSVSRPISSRNSR